jgi:(S)-citramalyl-CoA lyase
LDRAIRQQEHGRDRHLSVSQLTGFPRHWLFTPGSRPDRFAKAAASKADALIVDLEDAVAEDGKAEARANVLAFLSSGVTDKTIVVRVNRLSRVVGLQDLVALAQHPVAPDYLLIPKIEEPSDLTLAAHVLDDCGSSTGLVGLVESARGIAQAANLARATPRLAAMMFGAADYAADLGQQVGTYRPDFARASLVNAAASGGIVAIDSPFFSIDRPDELAAECTMSRALGFYGKAAIHPAQLDAIEAHFSVTSAEKDQADRILAAAPDGVGVLDGKMIDIAMVRWARRILERHI